MLIAAARCRCLIQSSENAVLRQFTALDTNLEARDRELTEIAKSIAQLAELFKDLSALVIDQGTLLDSVEYNIEQTAAQMEDAVRELDTATRWVPVYSAIHTLRRAPPRDSDSKTGVAHSVRSLLPASVCRDPSSRASPGCPVSWSFSSGLIRGVQVPEEHRAAPVHLPAPPDHLWPHHRAHLQATPTPLRANTTVG